MLLLLFFEQCLVTDKKPMFVVLKLFLANLDLCFVIF